jgi:hypothetical protein
MTERVINIAFRIVFHSILVLFSKKKFLIMLFYLFMYSNMWHIVGFRKIISFKIRIKKYTKLFEKTKLTII